MRIIKFIVVSTWVVSYFLTSPLVYLRYYFDRAEFIKNINKLVSFYVSVASWLLNIEITSNENEVDWSKNYLVVGNHLSYLDIFALSSQIPTSYVTSLEMKKTPLLGQVVILAGCIFVDRKSRDNRDEEILDITENLAAGNNVTVYPEATSTNGEQVLPFKRSMFQAAINSKKDILPFTLNYTEINGEKVSLKNRDLLCWYGDMDFGPHFWALCGCKSAKAKITFHHSISSRGVEDTKILRDLSYQAVDSDYKKITS